MRTPKLGLAQPLTATLAALLAGLAMLAGLALLWAPPRTGATLVQIAAATTLDARTPLEQTTPAVAAMHTPLLVAPARTSPTARPTAAPTATAAQPAGATPSASLWPTASRTPSATAVPLHPPADADPTRIQAEAIGLDAPVVTVGTREQIIDGAPVLVWVVAVDAAGFHQGSARPGHAGNTVITGHNNIGGEVFRELHRLTPGDRVLLWVGDRSYAYEVDAVLRIEVAGASPDRVADALSWIEPTEDQRLTLVTCWPYWGNSHRTIVVAWPVAR